VVQSAVIGHKKPIPIGRKAMAKKHDWNKALPHHVVTGKITTRAFAEKHPAKVEWVKNKKGT
jgi:hypothetical protein